LTAQNFLIAINAELNRSDLGGAVRPVVDKPKGGVVGECLD
jgi:hypothetical protein